MWLLLTVTTISSRTMEEQSFIPNNAVLTTAPAVSSPSTQAPIGETDSESNSTHACFYAPSDLCLIPRETEGCKECMPHPTIPNSLVCCNVTDIEKSISCVPNPSSPDNSSYWINLHIRNATLDDLDIPPKFWKRLDSLIVTDGNITNITKEFTKFGLPKCINISNNHLMHIHPRAFKDFTSLQMLDISYNNLSTVPNLNSIPTNLSLSIKYVHNYMHSEYFKIKKIIFE